jgi:signal transduction histidine kinase
LLGMRERVELAGGRLDLQSQPGEGTELHAFFPLEPLT